VVVKVVVAVTFDCVSEVSDVVDVVVGVVDDDVDDVDDGGDVGEVVEDINISEVVVTSELSVVDNDVCVLFISWLSQELNVELVSSVVFVRSSLHSGSVAGFLFPVQPTRSGS
jgi:hypothetical protein